MKDMTGNMILENGVWTLIRLSNQHNIMEKPKVDNKDYNKRIT